MNHLRHPAVVLPLLGALACLGVAHCGDDSTGRSRITVDAVVRGTDAMLTTSTGWAVQIEEARIAVGPLRWYEGTALFGRNLLERALGISVAYAHPGHYVAGEALADITNQRVVDLLQPGGVSLTQGNGVTGLAQSAAIELRPADVATADAATLHGGSLYLRATATKDGRTVRFDCAPAIRHLVQGIPAVGDMNRSGRWDIVVDVGAWIDRSDFSMVADPATPGAVVTLGDGQPLNAVTRTAPAASGFRFTWVPAGASADGGAR